MKKNSIKTATETAQNLVKSRLADLKDAKAREESIAAEAYQREVEIQTANSDELVKQCDLPEWLMPCEYAIITPECDYNETQLTFMVEFRIPEFAPFRAHLKRESPTWKFQVVTWQVARQRQTLNLDTIHLDWWWFDRHEPSLSFADTRERLADILVYAEQMCRETREWLDDQKRMLDVETAKKARRDSLSELDRMTEDAFKGGNYGPFITHMVEAAMSSNNTRKSQVAIATALIALVAVMDNRMMGQY
mgnify:FL=1